MCLVAFVLDYRDGGGVCITKPRLTEILFILVVKRSTMDLNSRHDTLEGEKEKKSIESKGERKTRKDSNCNQRREEKDKTK